MNTATIQKITQDPGVKDLLLKLQANGAPSEQILNETIDKIPALHNNPTAEAAALLIKGALFTKLKEYEANHVPKKLVGKILKWLVNNLL